MRIIVTCVLALAFAGLAACGEDPSAPRPDDNDMTQALYVRPLPFEQVSTTPDRPRIPRIEPIPVGGVDFDPSDELPLRDDAQVLQVLLTLNSGEIALANEALLRLRTAQTRDFAMEMREAHARANLKLRSVLDENGMDLKQSDVSIRLRESTLEELDVLRETNAVEVDKQFIALQVRMHRRALELIDEMLLPIAEHDDVHALVSAARTEIEHHLELALRLRILAEEDALHDMDM